MIRIEEGYTQIVFREMYVYAEIPNSKKKLIKALKRHFDIKSDVRFVHAGDYLYQVFVDIDGQWICEDDEVPEVDGNEFYISSMGRVKGDGCKEEIKC